MASHFHGKAKNNGKIWKKTRCGVGFALDLLFSRGFRVSFTAQPRALGVSSSRSPALHICLFSWVSCGVGGSDRLGLGFLIGAPSGPAWCFPVCFFDMSFCALCWVAPTKRRCARWLASARGVLCLRLPDRCPDRCRWRVVWRGWLGCPSLLRVLQIRAFMCVLRAKENRPAWGGWY